VKAASGRKAGRSVSSRSNRLIGREGRAIALRIIATVQGKGQVFVIADIVLTQIAKPFRNDC
jgi:hypothetical protein